MIGDGHAVGVATKVVQHMLGTAERGLSVDHPVFAEKQSQPGSESLGLRKRRKFSSAMESTVTERLPQAGNELAAKHWGEHFQREEEVIGGVHPRFVIKAQAAGGNDAMDVGMQSELLTPRVQHTEEANFCAEVTGIPSDFEKCFRAGAKQEAVEQFLVLQDQGGQLRRQREHDMNVARGKTFVPARGDPAIPSRGLALRAMSIAAGVVRDGAMPAAGALIEMTAECGGTTPPNGVQHFDVLPAQPVAVSFEESVSRSADQIGHLQRRPIHLLFLW